MAASREALSAPLVYIGVEDYIPLNDGAREDDDGHCQDREGGAEKFLEILPRRIMTYNDAFLDANLQETTMAASREELPASSLVFIGTEDYIPLDDGESDEDMHCQPDEEGAFLEIHPRLVMADSQETAMAASREELPASSLGFVGTEDYIPLDDGESDDDMHCQEDEEGGAEEFLEIHPRLVMADYSVFPKVHGCAFGEKIDGGGKFPAAEELDYIPLEAEGEQDCLFIEDYILIEDGDVKSEEEEVEKQRYGRKRQRQQDCFFPEAVETERSVVSAIEDYIPLDAGVVEGDDEEEEDMQRCWRKRQRMDYFFKLRGYVFILHRH